MEAKITIAQPYPVIWNHPDREEDEAILAWLRANIVDEYEVIILGSNALKVVIGSNIANTSSFKPEDCLFLFKSPRDALLFKLTWGGR
jgi:hypothetical protein